MTDYLGAQPFGDCTYDMQFNDYCTADTTLTEQARYLSGAGAHAWETLDGRARSLRRASCTAI